MEVKAVVLIGDAPDRTAPETHGLFANTPLAITDVLGRPAVSHLVSYLRRQNVGEIAVVSEYPRPAMEAADRDSCRWVVAEGPQLWRAAESLFNELAQGGADEILVLRMGSYLEPDLDSLLQVHFANRTHATSALDEDGEPLDLWVVTAARRNDAAYLFRHGLRESRTRSGRWEFRGYRNRLQTPHDLRCLAVDGLLGDNAMLPAGTQVRPGVWIGQGASIHASARVLAPSFVGARARVCANAVITRCSVVERHTEIRMGSVIEDSTVLPYTSIGDGLDIMHSVAGGCRLASLEHDVAIEICDPRLVRALPHSLVDRASGALLSWFVLRVPMVRRLFRPRRAQPAQLPDAVTPPPMETPSGFPSAGSSVQATSRIWQ